MKIAQIEEREHRMIDLMNRSLTKNELLQAELIKTHEELTKTQKELPAEKEETLQQSLKIIHP